MHMRSYLQRLSRKTHKLAQDDEETFDPFAPVEEDEVTFDPFAPVEEDEDYLSNLTDEQRAWLQKNVSQPQPQPQPQPQQPLQLQPEPEGELIEPDPLEPQADYSMSQPGTPEHREAIFSMQDVEWQHPTHNPSEQLLAFDRLPGNELELDRYAQKMVAGDLSGRTSEYMARQKLRKAMIRHLGEPRSKSTQETDDDDFVDQRLRFFRLNYDLIPDDVQKSLYDNGIVLKDRKDMTEQEVADGKKSIRDANVPVGGLLITKPIDENDPESPKIPVLIRKYRGGKGETVSRPLVSNENQLTQWTLGTHPDNPKEQVWLADAEESEKYRQYDRSYWEYWKKRAPADKDVKTTIDKVFSDPDAQASLLGKINDLIYNDGVKSDPRVIRWARTDVGKVQLDAADRASVGLTYGKDDAQQEMAGEDGDVLSQLIQEEEKENAMSVLDKPGNYSKDQVVGAARVLDQMGAEIPDNVVESLEDMFGTGDLQRLALGLTNLSDKDVGKSTVDSLRQPVYGMLGNISAMTSEVADMMRIIAPRKMEYDKSQSRPSAEDAFFRLHARADLMELASEFSIDMAEKLLGTDTAQVQHILSTIEKARKKKKNILKLTHPDIPRLSLQFDELDFSEGFDSSKLNVGNYSSLLSYGPGLTEYVRDYINKKSQAIQLSEQGVSAGEISAQTGLNIPDAQRTIELGPLLIDQLKSQAFAKKDTNNPTSLSTNMTFWTPDIAPSVISVMTKDALENKGNRKYPPDTRRTMMNMFGTLGGYKDPATANFYGQGFSVNALWGEGAGVRNYQLYLKIMSEIMGDLPDQSDKDVKKRIDPGAWETMRHSPAPSSQLREWGAMPEWGNDPEKFWKELSTKIRNIRKEANKKIENISEIRSRMESLRHAQSSISYLNHAIKSIADQASEDIRLVIESYAN